MAQRRRRSVLHSCLSDDEDEEDGDGEREVFTFTFGRDGRWGNGFGRNEGDGDGDRVEEYMLRSSARVARVVRERRIV
jgi:hypothetical protein